MRTFVAADLHLTSYTQPSVAGDFVRLLDRCSGEHVVFAGDFFDLPTEAPDKSRRAAVAQIFAKNPPVRAALGRHLEKGGKLSFCSGNHDAALGQPGFEHELAELLALDADEKARIVSSPWFLREGSVHIEHGHFYDPDNTPEHPLFWGQDPLGVHFSAKFVNPTGAHRYHHANDSTPLKLFLSAFRWYGPRAPYVIYKYFTTAFAALARSGPFYRANDERNDGKNDHGAFAARLGIAAEEVDSILSLGAASTMRSFRNTFARMYLDRVVATLLIAGGAGSLQWGGRRAGKALLGLGTCLMTLSWAHGHNRYRGSVVDRLSQAADAICDASDAHLVIFGHTHRAEVRANYANTGSFAFPEPGAGRPYLEIIQQAGQARALPHRLERAQ